MDHDICGGAHSARVAVKPVGAVSGGMAAPVRCHGHCVPIAAGLPTWAGSTLLLDAAWRRWERPDLVERLLPFRPGSIADAAAALGSKPDGDKNPSTSAAEIGYYLSG